MATNSLLKQANGQGQSITDSQGRLFISRTAHHDILFAASALTSPLKPFIGVQDQPGYVDGAAAVSRFFAPYGIAVSRDGSTLYAADTNNHVVRRVAINKVVSSTVFGASAVQALNVGASNFGVRGIDVDASGVLFMSDTINNCIWQYNTGNQRLKLLAGKPGSPGNADGVGTAARFNGPDLVQVTPDGQAILVADQGNRVVRTITRDGAVSTLGVA